MRLAVVLVLLAACGSSPAAPPTAPAAPPGPADALTLQALRGSWRWMHVTRAEGTYRIERERWLFDAIAADESTGRRVLLGRYRRDLAVLADDGRVFSCNQRGGYVQSALFDVRASVADDELVIEEVGYVTAPSPCEPGFRKLATYRVTLARPDVRLRWDDGEQTLEPMPAGSYTHASLAWPAPPADPRARVAGAWHWSLRSRDDDNNIRDEDEAWELAVAEDGTAGGTYVREVVVHSADGAPLPCAGASSYRFTDRYTLRGKLVGDQLELEEAAVDAGRHPCLTPTPTRHLDTATGTTDGEHLVLTWRGQRRQVLHRRD